MFVRRQMAYRRGGRGCGCFSIIAVILIIAGVSLLWFFGPCDFSAIGC